MTQRHLTQRHLTQRHLTQRHRLTGRIRLGLVALAALAVLPLLASCASAGTSAPPSGSIPAQSAPGEAAGTTVAFYGDSYTLGTGASDPASRWSSIVSAERGWHEVNPSADGVGFVANRDMLPGLLDQVIAANPDIVIVTMGLNDNFVMPDRADDIRAAITADLTTLSSALPRARLIVVEPFWYTDERPASVERIIGWVRAAAGRVDADYISGASHWIEGHPEWMSFDGLHPNDEGYQAMAERMDAELEKLGL